MRYGLSILVSALVLASAQAGAGVVVTSAYKNLATNQNDVSTIYMETDRLKVVSPESTTIYRADQNRLWAIDMRRRSYTEITPQMMQQMSGQLSGAMAQMQQQLAVLPPEQRAMVEQMMAGRGVTGAPPAGGGGAPPTYTRAGGTKTIAGWSCDVVRKTANGQQQEELCIARLATAGLTAADLRVLASLQTFMAPIPSSPMVPQGAYTSWRDMNRAIGFEGVPLDTIRYANGRPSTQETVTRIDRQTIAPAEFNLPAGLTQQTMGGPGR